MKEKYLRMCFIGFFQRQKKSTLLRKICKTEVKHESATEAKDKITELELPNVFWPREN